MINIDDFLARLNPKIAAGFMKASETHNHLLKTPSLGVNRAIGGFGYGRQSLLWGNRSGGKTAFLLQTAAIAQKDDKMVAWIDAEKNFDQAWAARLGVDPDQMAISSVTSIADAADATHDVIKAGADVVVVDSISSLLPQSYFDDDGEMKNLAKTGQIGTFSKNIGSYCNMVNNINKDTAFILISQVRNAIGSYGASKTYMGGMSVEHMNSTVLKLWSNPSEKESIKQDVTEGNFIFKRPVGRSVTWTVDKNRGPGMNYSGDYDLYFNGTFVGIDLAGEIIDASVEFGLIKRGGAGWYTIGDTKLQGRPAASKYLRDNPDVQERLYGEIIEVSI